MSDLESVDRRKRVNRLKKLIILLLVTLLVIPIIMCVLMFMRVSSLENELREMHTQIEQIAFEQSKYRETLDNHVEQDAAQKAEKNQDKQVSADVGDAEVNTSENTTGSMGGEDASGNPQPSVDTQTVLAQSDLVAKVSTADTEYNPELDENIRKVYLTFDDGPSENTDAILDVLAQYNVKATFFLVGKDGAMAEEAMRRIVDDGHTIGMHTYSHKYSQIYASVEAFAEDFLKLQEHIYNVTGVKSTYFRFPGGSSNEVSDTDITQLIDWVHGQGIEYYDWNASGDDALSLDYDAKTIVENCIRDIKKYNVVIVLLHDAKNKNATVEALPMLIEEIQAMENTVILPITEYTVPIQHTTKETED